MIIPDASLLIYAYDSGSPFHSAARKWWEDCLSGSEPVGIPNVVVLAFVRLMTHPSLSQNPASAGFIVETVRSWIEAPCCRVLPSTEKTTELFLDLIIETGLGGNLTTDSWIAATALEYGGTVYSNDRDFSRFRKLPIQNPLE